nr:hypothetical protein [Tanacetum cinerariifolium]
DLLRLVIHLGNGIDVVVSVKSNKAISKRNTWGKYGLVKSMLSSSTELFSFQFSSMDGLNAMLENGSWFIRNHPLILKKWNPNVNLLKEDVGNVLVWVKLHGVSVTAFSEDWLSAIATRLGTPLMLDSYSSDMCLQSWGRSSYARAMIELRADVELKDTIVVAMPKIVGEGFYTCTIRVEKRFKPTKEYRPVFKKSTKKKCVEPTKEVSNSNPFDVLNSVVNDVELVETSSTSTIPNVDKIGKLEKLIIDGKVTLVDDDGRPLKKVDYPGERDSEDEVESVDNDMARSMASEIVSFGTKSLLEQWSDSYENCDYNENPYDDDMYEGQEFPDKIQDICDNLDIIVRGRKKK